MKKAEDAEVDTAEQSAIKLRSQQQTSSAIVVADQPPVNGSVPASNHLTLVKMPSQNITEVLSSSQLWHTLDIIHESNEVNICDIQDSNVTYEEPPVEIPKENGAPVEVESKVENIPETNIESKVEPPAVHPASQADLLADLLGPLAIEGPPAAVEQNPVQGLETNQSPVGDLALATLEDQSNSVQVHVYFLIAFVPPSNFILFYTMEWYILTTLPCTAYCKCWGEVSYIMLKR